MIVAKQNLSKFKRIGWIDNMGQRRILAGAYVAQGKYERALKLLNAGKFEKLFPIRM